MNLKIIFGGIGFVIALFMAGYFLSPNKGPEIWRFISKFDGVTNQIVTELNNQNEPNELKRIENAQAILEQINKDDGLPMKDSLKQDLAKLKVSGDIQTTETTEQALNNCLGKNVQRVFDIYKTKSDSIAAKVQLYQSAKDDYEENKDIQKFNEMKEIVKQLKPDKQVVIKLRAFFRAYKSILN